MLNITWQHRDIYSKIIPVMGFFHQMCVFERLLSKRYNCVGLKDWVVDSGTIAGGSIGQVFEWRHYYRSIPLHKGGFHASVRRVEDITNEFELIHPDILSNISELRQKSSNKTLEHVRNKKEYKELVTAVLSTTETRSQMVVDHLKEVSTMAAIIPEVETSLNMFKLKAKC